MIKFKDIFKPRYALIVSIEKLPNFAGSYDSFPAVPLLPLKRPLSMPFNDFINEVKLKGGENCMVIAGSYLTLRGIYGIGSCLKHNLKNAVLIKYNPQRT